MAGYRSDLAYIHDSGFSDFSLNAAPGLLSLLRRHGADRGLVVDLGCGSGIWARQLGFAGYDVLGVDISPAMIRLARKRAPKGKFITASLTDVELPSCAAVTSIGECVSYSFAGDEEGESLQRFFGRVHAALPEGGPFIFDFAQPGREPGGMPRKGFWTGKDWAVLVAAQAGELGVATRWITTFRKIGQHYRRCEEIHELRVYETERLQAMLRTAGFESRALKGFGGLRFRSGHAGLIARKRQ